MSADPNKKSGRSFQCRDVLWETFEQMARELECSVDYLINEAMKQYARQRSYGGASRTPYPGQRPETGAPPMMPPQQGYPGGQLPPPPMAQGQMRQLTAPVSQRLPPPPTRGGTQSLPAAPPPMRSMQPVPPPPAARQTLSPQTRPPPSRVPPPMPRPPTAPTAFSPQQQTNGFPAPPPPAPTHGGMLSVVYQGEKLPVTKDRFVIGRGKQSSDLTLKDPNVSRQHAMVEFQNGVYFMVDMGSTNGVEYNGQRIARKQIAEGDIFRICDHEMRFTYR
jgi:hypothetical protein